MDLQFNIVYKQGNTNQAADALSRCPVVSTIFAVSACTPLWVENLIKGYEDDPVASQLLAELALSPHGTKDYTITDGVIRFRGRIWIGNNALAQQHVLQALHTSGIGGHSGFHGTYHHVKALFAWPKMKDSIRKFVLHCLSTSQG
jgi:hypothetical protein